MPSPRSRWLTWWALAEYASRHLTQPTTDIVASDAEVQRLVVGSTAGRTATRVMTAVIHAWMSSRTWSLMAPLYRDWLLLDRAAAIRIAGIVLTVAALVAFTLQAIAPTPIGPWGAVLPAACTAAGVVTVLCAPAIARLSGAIRS